MEKQILKELLKNIKADNYAVPMGLNPYELSLEMLDNIGVTDSELRDNLILSNLCEWIDNGTLSTEEVYKLLVIAIDENHLLKGLGQNDDTVFCRTFSVEVIASIIYRHRKEKFISNDDIQKAFTKVLKFCNDDKDVRGFVKGKGWAHGAAHGADALDEFVRCEEIGYVELKEVLSSIYKKITINNYGYIHFEDERIITVFKAILERKIIDNREIEDWVKSFSNIEKVGMYPEDLVIEFNANTFLKSLYFRLIDKSEYENLASVVKDVINQISRFN